jgi:hypothetical protein
MNLTPEAVLPPLDPQRVPRSPAAAFFLSLLIPGAGQFYCQKISRGFWTLLSFAPVSLVTLLWTFSLVTLSTDADLVSVWGWGVRFCLLLYIFAFVDAYFTAREMTAGADAHIPENPRVAGILNLLTRGFGYWYLGERTKGLAVFVGLAVIPYVILLSVPQSLQSPLSILVELLVAVFVVDAYRIARRRRAKILARIRPAAAPVPSPGLPAAVPVALAVLLGAAYLGLAATAALFPDYRSIDQASARVTRGPEQNSYANPKYGVALTAPASWQINTAKPRVFLEASGRMGACNATFLAETRFPLLTVNRYAAMLTRQLQINPAARFEKTGENPASLGGLPARELVFSVTSGPRHSTQRYLFAQRGLSLYVLILTVTDLGAEDCGPDLQFLREHLSLPH